MEYGALCENMGRQINCYQELLQLAQSKKELLVAGQVQDLNRLLQNEQKLIVHAGRLEADRLQLLIGLAVQLNLAVEEITLGHVINALEEPAAKQVRELQAKLQVLLTQLQVENELNQRLIRQFLDYVRFSLSLAQTGIIPLFDQKA
ncbi:MAG: flagellar protein FlgN [bacterium]|jgi:phospholipase/lecithinase/hemolysin